MSKVRFSLIRDTNGSAVSFGLLSKTAESYCTNVDWYLVFKYFPTDSLGNIGRLISSAPFGVYKRSDLKGDVSFCLSRYVAPAPDASSGTPRNASYLTSVVCHIRKMCYGESYSCTLPDLFLSDTRTEDVDLTQFSNEGKIIFVFNVIYQSSGGSLATFSYIDLGNDKSTRDFFLQMFISQNQSPSPRIGAPDAIAGRFVSGIVSN